MNLLIFKTILLQQEASEFPRNFYFSRELIFTVGRFANILLEFNIAVGITYLKINTTKVYFWITVFTRMSAPARKSAPSIEIERAPPLLKIKDYIGQKQRITLQCVKNNLKN